jgi:hypothetical protein
MGWYGYFVFGGNEIINTERTEKYIEDARQPWFQAIYNSTSVGTLTGETYVDPWNDPAPWSDPDQPDTNRFWGAYPLDISGLEDDTRQAVVTENVVDGGWVGPVRKGSRSIVFNVMLSGEDECAVEAGFRWLKQALTAVSCTDESVNGSELCYYSCEPCLFDNCTAEQIAQCREETIRTLRNVKIVSGPTVTARRTTSNGASVWVATFTAVAGVPFEFGNEVPLVEGFMVDPDPWVPSVTPADWEFSTVGTVYVDESCATPIYEPIIDPLCPAVITPPGPPSIRLGCFTPPEAWDRRWFTIPRKYVPYWGDVVPVVKVQAIDEVRNLRLRFYTDVNADASVLDDPCSYCGDILFSYIPPDHTLIFDGVTQTVYAQGPGGTNRRADSLVFKTDGTPFEWPLLSCGFGFVVAVDLPENHTGALPAVDLSVTARAS